MWSLSVEAARERPVLGYGYGAFWHPDRPDGADAAVLISSRLNYPVAHAHNGLIDAALTLGGVGAALAIGLVGGLLLCGARAARQGRQEAAVVQLSFGLLIVVSNIAESSFLRENNLLTILFVAGLASTRTGASLMPLRSPKA